jgi:bacillithiol biosynthesis deacetylase BshB2
MEDITILAVLAHPDDETFICGGTLAKYAKQGADITLVSATKGEMGRRMGNPPYLTRESMPAAREKELREACGHLGIRELKFLGIRDKCIEYEDQEELVQRIVRIIRETKPSVLLTFHEKLGGHPDHCAIGKSAARAFHLAGEGDYAQDKSLPPFTPKYLYYISYGDAMKHPERFGLTAGQIVQIDISGHLPAKLAAYRAHRSQTELDEWVWREDSKALKKFGTTEYFIIGDGLPGNRRDTLFDRSFHSIEN